jgi:ABC-type sugar transport system substrate-binding protein
MAKKTLVGLLMAALVALLTACGSSSSSSSGSSSASSGSTSGGSGEASSLVKESEEVTADALSGVVYGSAKNPLHPNEMEPYGKWRGPTSGPAPQKEATVQIIICSGEAAACVETGKFAEKAMQELGWKTETIDGRGTPENLAKAFDIATSRKPDAILGVAIPTAIVSAKLQKAREQGIYLVSVADAEEPPPGLPAYDAYVPTRQNLSTALLAWAMIARSEGKANVIQIIDSGFPVVKEAQEQFEKVLGTCPECSIHKSEWQITDASNATKVNSIVRAAVTQDPEAEYIQMPYSIGIPFVLQTLREMGKPDIQVTSKDLTDEGVKEVSEGSVLYDVGNPLEWLGYASVNEIVRGLGGAKALTVAQIGLGVSLFDKEKAPSSGVPSEWPGWPEFVNEYKKLWGVK